MHVIIQHEEGTITAVRVADVAGQVRRSVPVAVDQDKLAVYLAANGGKTVLQQEFEQATHVYEQRLLLVMEGSVLECAVNTMVLPVSKLKGGATLLVDLLQNWQHGKYRVVDGAVVPTPSWVEPTIEIPAADE